MFIYCYCFPFLELYTVVHLMPRVHWREMSIVHALRILPCVLHWHIVPRLQPFGCLILNIDFPLQHWVFLSNVYAVRIWALTLWIYIMQGKTRDFVWELQWSWLFGWIHEHIWWLEVCKIWSSWGLNVYMLHKHLPFLFFFFFFFI